MKSFLKCFSLLIAMLSFTFNANAQENDAKEGFTKRAFRDMKESAKLQHQIDRANLRAVKLETEAFYEEQKRLSRPSVRTAAEKERIQREIEVANKRVEEAQVKVNNAKK